MSVSPKIVSFGDSFIYGSELQNEIIGAWPSLIAARLDYEYETFAVPGCGNDHIARQIYSYFSKNSTKDTLAVINWTWASRWDFYVLKPFLDKVSIDKIPEQEYNQFAGESWPTFDGFIKGAKSPNQHIQTEIDQFVNNLTILREGKWITLGPTCVPKNLDWISDSHTAEQLIGFYNEYANKSVLWNNFKTLQTISAVQFFLKTHNISNIQTYMDYEMFDTSADYLTELQNLVKPNVELFFENRNFLDWARDCHFAVTDSPGDHPLEQAHYAAADLWISRYKEKI